jgi:hypothetical protein
LFKILKSIENHVQLRKTQTNFHWNSLEHIYTMDLTKSLFVHYCLVENSKKSNIEVINYKNP